MTFIFAPRKSDRSIKEICAWIRLTSFSAKDWFIYSNSLRDNFMGVKYYHGINSVDAKVFTEGQPIIIDNNKFFNNLKYLTQYDPELHNRVSE